MKIVPLGGYDSILGMDWLALWGEMTLQDLWIHFNKDGKLVTLQGMSEKPLDALHEISIEQIEKCSKGNDIWATVVVSMASTTTNDHIPDCIQHVLADFTDVFSDPQTLPPHRAFDRAISLLPDSAPVNSSPYMYSPQQKDEIEKQIMDMIVAGIVTPSMSPCASPVLCFSCVAS